MLHNVNAPQVTVRRPTLRQDVSTTKRRPEDTFARKLPWISHRISLPPCQSPDRVWLLTIHPHAGPFEASALTAALVTPLSLVLPLRPAAVLARPVAGLQGAFIAVEHLKAFLAGIFGDDESAHGCHSLPMLVSGSVRCSGSSGVGGVCLGGRYGAVKQFCVCVYLGCQDTCMEEEDCAFEPLSTTWITGNDVYHGGKLYLS